MRPIFRRLLLAALAIVPGLIMLTAPGCANKKKSGNVTNSRDLMTFTPAAPDKQVLTKDGKSPQILITNYNETATDALGRTLPTSEETGLPKEGKYVGLFYSLWTASISAPTDVTKALAQDPQDPNFGPKWGFCFWSEPETGYHKADDVWQIKRDMYYFAMAGVDFLYIDMTNGYLYEDAMHVFLDTCLELRAAGQMTPYVVPWCFGTDLKASHGDTGKFYDIFMTDEKYSDLWFYWDGKPLALIKPTDDGEFPIYDDPNYKDKLTFKKSWVGDGENWWVDGSMLYGLSYGWSEDPGKAECVGIGVAGFANYGSGRSANKSVKRNLDQFWETQTMGEGIMLERTFNDAMETVPDVDVLLITRWNEWIAQNFTQDDPKPTSTGYVDQFNREFSRDIEPMKGGFTDNYFYQMCSIIRKFKGVLPPDGNSGKQTVDIDGAFSQWESITPVFTDFEGDTSERDSTDTTGKIKYINKTGRNDIVESRLTASGGMIYAYARTAAPLTSPADGRNWMLLFIDADNDKSTGWEGYDYVVNYQVIDNALTTLCAYKDDIWQEIGAVRYRAESNELMLSIPRSLLGLTGDKFTLNFHWLDNVTDIYSLESWFTTGDSAPERRNNYTLTLSIPYRAADETICETPQGRTAIAYMPALELTADELDALNEGLFGKAYKLTENYGKLPEFGLIEGIKSARKGIAKTVCPDFINGVSKNFAVALEGFVKLDADGRYTFKLTCDDCAKLYIDGRTIAECPLDSNRDAEATVTAEASLRLAAGYHQIRVEYAEVREGNPKLELEIGGGEYSYFYK
ncbi:MAG: hypothetical protein J5584_06050 [Clostridia bacterium]|nr:hypothetical protein [Clostridia bacterium]